MDRSAAHDDPYMDDVGVAPAFVMPVQVVDRQFQGARLQPEKHLQLAVLADAVATHARTAMETTSYARQLFAEVDEWFACDVAAGPFSFIGICDSLGIEPGYVRRGLRRLRRIDASPIVRKLTRHQTGPRHQAVRPRERRVA
jgi:hypothetical protein